MKIDTFLYPFYSEFYNDSESVTVTFLGLLQYFGRYRPWKFGQNPKNYVFCGKIRHGYYFFCSQSVGSGKGYSRPLLNKNRLFYVPMRASKCRFRGERYSFVMKTVKKNLPSTKSSAKNYNFFHFREFWTAPQFTPSPPSTLTGY